MKKHEESPADKLSRLELMASGDPKWDLSDNDLAALRYGMGIIKRSLSTEATTEAFPGTPKGSKAPGPKVSLRDGGQHQPTCPYSSQAAAKGNGFADCNCMEDYFPEEAKAPGPEHREGGT